jgi:hypothetical protein
MRLRSKTWFGGPPTTDARHREGLAIRSRVADHFISINC